jgi:Uma2 family endonuclease
LIDGEVLRMPPAEFRHTLISLRIYDFLKEALRILHGQSQARDLGLVLHEGGYRMGHNWLIPDVSITHASQNSGRYLEGAPALAIEAISESNTARMMHRKVRKYLENGCREVWVFYPETASVLVHSGKTAVERDCVLTSDLLPGITVDLAPIFAG